MPLLPAPRCTHGRRSDRRKATRGELRRFRSARAGAKRDLLRFRANLPRLARVPQAPRRRCSHRTHAGDVTATGLVGCTLSAAPTRPKWRACSFRAGALGHAPPSRIW